MIGAAPAVQETVITCVACGYHYAVSEGQDTCGSCPLHEACSTSCCPKCGTNNINPDKSRLARWLQRVFDGGSNAASHG
ncbi:MAG: hypothetical protein ACYCYG_12325 [Bellilinea sp.]